MSAFTPFVLVYAMFMSNGMVHTDHMPKTYESYEACQAKQVEMVRKNWNDVALGNFVAVCVER